MAKGRPRKQGVQRDDKGRIARRVYENSRPPSVYFAAMTGRRLVKIGYSKAPSRRMTCMGVGNPDGVFIVGLVQFGFTEEAKSIEGRLHRALDACGRHHVGEWFSMSMHEVEAMLRALDTPYLMLLNDIEFLMLVRGSLSIVGQRTI